MRSQPFRPELPATRWRRYVALLCATSLTALAAVAMLNYQVDPYLIHQWDTAKVRQLRPGREKLGAWGKTYALARLRPAVVYAGNSRTELGLPTATAQFGARTVFNAGLSGASLGDAMAMVAHAVTVGPPAVVVWGIDAPSFSLEVGNTDFDRALVATDRWYLWRRTLIDLQRAVTPDMTLDTLRLLRGTFGAICHSSLALYGQRDDVCVRDRIDGWGGTRGAVLPRIREFIRGAGPTRQALAAFDQSLGRLCGARVQVRAYINPTHAMTVDALYRAGKGAALEQWQRDLAALFERYRDRGCDARVVDFSGFNSITTEPVPQASGRAAMTYYWETSHYRTNVGHLILARLAGNLSVPSDFGVELAPQTVALHQARQRVARARYHREHPVEAAAVMALVQQAPVPVLPVR
ncbi:MAG: hypothetical protein ABW069_17915 [Duganella sp.]